MKRPQVPPAGGAQRNGRVENDCLDAWMTMAMGFEAPLCVGGWKGAPQVRSAQACRAASGSGSIHGVGPVVRTDIATDIQALRWSELRGIWWR